MPSASDATRRAVYGLVLCLLGVACGVLISCANDEPEPVEAPVVIPEDVQKAFYPVCRHRLISSQGDIESKKIINMILAETPFV